MKSPPIPTASEGEVTLGVASGFSVHTVFSIQRLFSKFFPNQSTEKAVLLISVKPSDVAALKIWGHSN